MLFLVLKRQRSVACVRGFEGDCTNGSSQDGSIWADTQQLTDITKWLTLRMASYLCPLPSSERKDANELHSLPSRPAITQWVVWWKEPNLDIEMKGVQKRNLEQRICTRHGLSPEMSNEVIYLSAGTCCLVWDSPNPKHSLCDLFQQPDVSH